jgi:hypothetical protein
MGCVSVDYFYLYGASLDFVFFFLSIFVCYFCNRIETFDWFTLEDMKSISDVIG